MRCKNNGFTLIELLVAISILAIVAVLGWRGLDSIIRSREVLTSELELAQGLQLTFAQLQSDCTQNVNLLSYTNLPEERSSWIEPQRIIILRNEYQEDQAPSMQIVVYRLKDSNLTRFESISTRDLAVLKQLLDQARNPADDQVEIVMLKNVQNLEFSGYPSSSLTSNANSGLNVSSNNSGRFPSNGNNDSNPSNLPDNSNPQNSRDQQENNIIQKVDRTRVTTGLKVSLQLQNHDKKMTKIFMLGGA